MSQPADIHLPNPEDFKTDDIPVTGATLKSTAVYLGKYCDDLSKEFMLCKKEEKDPRKCLKEGLELTKCGLEFYSKLKRTCRPEIEAYALCIDRNDGRLPLSICRENRAYFDDCMKNKFGLERPEFGHFSQVRVHNSNRPKPERVLRRHEPTPRLPDNYEETIVKVPAQVSRSFVDGRS